MIVFSISGQVLNLLNKYATEPNIATFPSWVQTRLQDMYVKVKHIADSSIKYLKKKAPEYYTSLKYLVEYPMTVAREYHRIDPTLVWDATERINITGGKWQLNTFLFQQQYIDNKSTYQPF